MKGRVSGNEKCILFRYYLCINDIIYFIALFNLVTSFEIFFSCEGFLPRIKDPKDNKKITVFKKKK